jgi:undecaprenol kinase/diacylglycerol kinase (ATP)
MEEAGRSPGSDAPSIGRTLRSFRFALAGIRYLAQTQPNFRVHLVATVAVLVVALLVESTASEVAVLLLAIGLVLVAEALNTSVEAVVDLASPDFHPLAKVAKDTAAAGVLIAAVVAALVGLIVLGPRLLLRVTG